MSIRRDIDLFLLLCICCVPVGVLRAGAVDSGRETFAAQKCVLCHSISGIGGKKLALDGVGSRLKAEDIRKWIRSPGQMKAKTIMKPRPSLLERDLEDLVAFLSTLR